jgi:anti-sigma B factor antagonist
MTAGGSVPHVEGGVGEEPAVEQLMRLSWRSDQRCLLLAVEGEIDVLTAPRLEAALREGVANAALRPLILDLSGVELLSSAGLHALFEARGWAEELTEPLRVVVGHARAVLWPLEATGMAALLCLYESVTDALTDQA